MPRKMKYLKPVQAYIPVKLNINKLVEGTSFNPDRIRALCHLLYTTILYNSIHYKEKDKDVFSLKFAQIHRNRLVRIVGGNYLEYIEFLKQSKVIEVNDKYFPGAITKRYKFHFSVFNPLKIRRFKEEPIKDYCTLKAILNDRKEQRKVYKRAILLEPIHKELVKSCNRIKFDIDKYEKYLESVEQGKVEWPLTRKKKNNLQKKQPLNEFLLLMSEINKDENIECVVDNFGMRFHSVFTSLWKGLRKYMYFEDEPNERLVNLDISNSQPYFASISVNPQIIEKFIPEFSACIPILKEIENKKDYKRFAKLCAKGQIYDYWKDLRNQDLDKAEMIQRDTAKEEIFQIMFSRVRSRDPELIKRKEIFNENFPSVNQAFNSVKSLSEKHLPFVREIYLSKNGKFLGKHAYHKNLSCMMERIESNFILKTISQRLIDNGFKDFITIHDSLLIKEKDLDFVSRVLDEEFQKLPIIKPKIKVEQII